MVIKRSIQIVIAVMVTIIGAIDTMAIEEAKYKVLQKENMFEIRDYASHILAETIVEGDLEGAGNKAFDRLFRYISGDNRSQQKSGDDSSCIPTANGRENQDDGPRSTASSPGKVGLKLHDASLIYSRNSSRARGPKYHLASGSGSTDGCGALFRFLERKTLP